jgi:pimeloyl-ACP methyl ester carboxylesterase
MLPKLLSPKTYIQNPELVELVHQIMESTSLEGILGDLAGLKDRPDSTETLAGLKIPALIIHGNDDQLVPPEAARSMHALLPHAQLEILQDAGHLPNLEQPALFNQAVRRYLSSLQ